MNVPRSRMSGWVLSRTRMRALPGYSLQLDDDGVESGSRRRVHHGRFFHGHPPWFWRRPSVAAKGQRCARRRGEMHELSSAWLRAGRFFRGHRAQSGCQRRLPCRNVAAPVGGKVRWASNGLDGAIWRRCAGHRYAPWSPLVRAISVTNASARSISLLTAAKGTCATTSAP
jgi:hypothetical protein